MKDKLLAEGEGIGNRDTVLCLRYGVQDRIPKAIYHNPIP